MTPASRRPWGAGARAALGALVVAAHAIGFALLAAHCHGHELAVELHAPPASPSLTLDGRVPAALAARTTIDDSGHGPGLHRRTWRVRYRGGVERAVGAVQLVGPFQDPQAPACSGRVVVGQRLLDDGHAGPGTIAAAMHAALTAELGGESVFPVGDFQRIAGLALRWATLATHPGDRALVGAAPHGYVRVTATVVFERVSVPLTVALVPEPSPRALEFRIATRAELSFANRYVQWVSDELGADRLASRLAQRQIDSALITALAPPPPFTLAGGQTLRFTYCDEPIEIADGAYAALPFGVALGRAGDPRILPPRFGHGPRVAPPAGTALGLDVELDALNALLYELWRGGFLDRQLAAAGLDRRFNHDPTVEALLSVRLAPPVLSLPPVISVEGGDLRLGAEARVAIHDGQATTWGRVWGGLVFRFAPAPRTSASGVVPGIAPVDVQLDQLALSCERDATTRVPCYGDLVGAIASRSSEFHAALTQSFTALLSNIFVGRIGAAGIPADLVIRGVIPSLKTSDDRATLHLELAGEVSANH